MIALEISLPSLFAQAALVLFISYVSYNYFLHPLSKLPGPLIAHLGVPSWMYLRIYHRDMVWGLHREHLRWGKDGIMAPMIRVGANGVDVADPETAHEIYSVSNRLPKTDFYEALTTDQRPKGPNTTFYETDNKYHAIIKKQTSIAYSQAAVADVAPFATPQLELLVSKLSTIAKAEGKVDFGKWLGLFAFDAVADLAFGTSFGCMEGGGDGGVGEINERFLREALFLATHTWLIPLARFRDRIFRLTPAVHRIFTVARPIAEARLKQLKRGETPRADLLTKFILGKGSDTTSELSMFHILSHAADVLIAGTDTTANFLRSFFQLVLSDPRIYQTLKKEVSEAVEEGKVSQPASQAQAIALPYLQLCILEAQRYSPIVGLPLPRKVPSPDGMKFGEVHIPGGTSIGSSAWLVHRNKALYGEDAEVFRPERWSEVDKETKGKMERSLQFFGAGTRICAGRYISQMEYTRAILTLLMNFDFSIIPRAQGSPHTHPHGTNISTGEKDVSAPSTIDSRFFNQFADFHVQIKSAF